MCGHVGVAGDVTALDEKVFLTLLNLDTVRGPDSTGVLQVARHGVRTEVIKELGTPWDLWEKKDVNGFLAPISRLLMGHNRWATMGAIDKVNAHPFDCGNIIGAHNGTLINQTLLDDHEVYDVDSENIFQHMQTNGIDDTISKLHGAYALVWYNKEEESLNFVRNAQRPLHYCYDASGMTLYWASEAWMLTVAAERHDLKIGKIESFPIDKHYKVQFASPMIKREGTEAYHKNPDFMEKMRIKPVVPYVPKQQQGGWKEYYPKWRRVGGESPALTSPFDHFSPEDIRRNFSYVINREIEFVVRGTIKDSVNGATYLKAITVYDSANTVEGGIEVRVFLPQDKSRDHLNITGQLFAGTVRKITTTNGSFYLLVNGKTVNKVQLENWYQQQQDIWDDDLPEDRVQITPTKSMSVAHFARLASEGCQYCSHPVEISEVESGEVVFMDNDKPIHAECLSFYNHQAVNH